jgi:hypothetical protein
MPSDVAAFPAEGGCVCGKLRYRVEKSPMVVHCCFCTWCQQESGGKILIQRRKPILSALASNIVNSIIETAEISFLPPKNEPSAVPITPLKVDTPSHSGLGQIITRCPACYVAVMSLYGGSSPSIAFLRTGTLDRKDIVKPDVYIYTSSKPPWVVLDKDTPAFEKSYNFRELWSKEAQERMMAVHSSKEQ